MSPNRATQAMKPITAAKKLGVHLPATPPEFQAGPVTRDDLDRMLADPPAWLVHLRRNGPHPRPEVARKLGISQSGLARANLKDALTTAEIQDLLAAMPDWLAAERATQAEVRAENARLKARDADRRAKAEAEGTR